MVSSLLRISIYFTLLNYYRFVIRFVDCSPTKILFIAKYTQVGFVCIWFFAFISGLYLILLKNSGGQPFFYFGQFLCRKYTWAILQNLEMDTSRELASFNSLFSLLLCQNMCDRAPVALVCSCIRLRETHNKLLWCIETLIMPSNQHRITFSLWCITTTSQENLGLLCG
jgi:hypothetical protein